MTTLCRLRRCLIVIAAKICNALQRNRIEPKIENISRKNQNGFQRNRSTTSQILTIRRILEGVRAKNIEATILFVDFAKAFDSIYRGKMEQIQLAYDLPKETVEAIIVKEKWTYPRKNVLVCAWHAKAKMAALTCFKNSRSRILTRLTRRVQRSKPIKKKKKTDSRSVRWELKRCGWRETIYPADWKRQFRWRF